MRSNSDHTEHKLFNIWSRQWEGKEWLTRNSGIVQLIWKKGKFLQTKLTFWLIALIPAFKICWSFLQKWNQNYMQKIIMLTTSAMTMLRSREDQRVQKDCRWSVPRAQSCDKSDKTPDVKIEKRQMWQNTRCQNWEKMNKAKHSCMPLHLLFFVLQNNVMFNLEFKQFRMARQIARVSCAVNVGFL